MLHQNHIKIHENLIYDIFVLFLLMINYDTSSFVSFHLVYKIIIFECKQWKKLQQNIHHIIMSLRSCQQHHHGLQLNLSPPLQVVVDTLQRCFNRQAMCVQRIAIFWPNFYLSVIYCMYVRPLSEWAKILVQQKTLYAEQQ